MRVLRIFSGVMILLFATPATSQEIVKGYFRSPLDIPLLLSGGFGEHRANHFHTGLDIKTQGVEGKKVYAAAEGYVSRIRIGHYGYGKALYITHPNGFTTVYGHLSGFSGKLEKYIKQQQYVLESEEVDLDKLPDTLFRVKKGEVVAYSGNSGSSGGPHLHFEIRETATENPLNPLLFGFDIKDNIPPRILHIKVYPLNDTSSVEGTNSPRTYAVSAATNGHVIKNNAAINAYGYIGVAVHTNDQLDGSGNICGIYELELKNNGEKIFGLEMKKLTFATNRYINTHADYYELKEHKRDYHKSFLNGNNQLPVYTTMKDSGRITVNEKYNKHTLHYVLKDGHGNTSELRFSIVSDNKKLQAAKKEYPSSYYYRFTDTLRVSNESSVIKINPYSLYNDQWIYIKNDLILQNKELITDYRYLSTELTIGDESVPVQEYFYVSLKPLEISPPLPLQKLVVVHIDKTGSVSDMGGTYSDGFVTAKVRTFGKFALMIDTIAPVITLLNNFSTPVKILLFSVGDNLSGIETYKVYIDGKFVLPHYDVKKGRVSVFLNEEGIPAGEHDLKFVVTDERKNEAVFVSKFRK